MGLFKSSPERLRAMADDREMTAKFRNRAAQLREERRAQARHMKATKPR